MAFGALADPQTSFVVTRGWQSIPRTVADWEFSPATGTDVTAGFFSQVDASGNLALVTQNIWSSPTLEGGSDRRQRWLCIEGSTEDSGVSALGKCVAVRGDMEAFWKVGESGFMGNHASAIWGGRVANAGVAFYAVAPGYEGDNILIEVVDTGGAGPATAVVAVALGIATVTIDKVGLATTGSDIITLVNGSATVKKVIFAALPTGSTGAGVFPVTLANQQVTLRNGGTFNSTATTGTVGANNAVLWTSRLGNGSTSAKTAGNSLAFIIAANAGGAAGAVTAATSGGVTTITYDLAGGNRTALQMITDVNTDADSSALVYLNHVVGSTGAGNVVVAATTALTGGATLTPGSRVAVGFGGDSTTINTSVFTTANFAGAAGVLEFVATAAKVYGEVLSTSIKGIDTYVNCLLKI